MWLFLLLAGVQGQECDPSKNLDADKKGRVNTNKDCNYAGTCYDGSCLCCNRDPITLLPQLFDDGSGNMVADCPDYGSGYYPTEGFEPDLNRLIKCGKRNEYTNSRFQYYIPKENMAGWRCDNSAKTQKANKDKEGEDKYDPFASHAYYTDADGNDIDVRELVQEYYNKAWYWTGIIVPMGRTGAAPPGCRLCTSEKTCSWEDPYDAGKDPEVMDEGMIIGFAVDHHTYHDPACFRPEDPIPISSNPERCFRVENDYGYLAFLAFNLARDTMVDTCTKKKAEAGSAHDVIGKTAQLQPEYKLLYPDHREDIGIPRHYLECTAKCSKKKKDRNNDNACGKQDYLYLNKRLGNSITRSAFQHIIDTKVAGTQSLPPTRSPTKPPSPSPTVEPDDCYSKGYTNKLQDMEYIGAFEDCRGGLKEEFGSPGDGRGKTCESPYLICLPAANTPDQSPKTPFFGKDHEYTVDECSFECTWDQRCRGFEFEPTPGEDGNNNTGFCRLIDDVPVIGEGPEDRSLDGSRFNEKGLFVPVAGKELDLRPKDGAKALCFSKGGSEEEYCNPFFEAKDLNNEMLECYCPNNRKGFYHKKVKRTTANTRYCDRSDPLVADIDERIKQAQANRMFHLCENWCLFNTFKPKQESWYWNPWKTCWREQFSGVGTHRSYCNRVIRNPDTVEQQFINDRAGRFCKPDDPDTPGKYSQMPTPQPSTYAVTYKAAAEEQSCTKACAALGEKCSEVDTAMVNMSMNTLDYEKYFSDAGFTCSSYEEGKKDYAHPSYETATGKCLLRNEATGPETGCNWAVGVGYQRLCACTDSA